jgi:hypothetical protein
MGRSVQQQEHERAKDVLSEAVKVDSGEWIRIIQRAYPDNPKKRDDQAPDARWQERSGDRRRHPGSRAGWS